MNRRLTIFLNGYFLFALAVILLEGYFILKGQWIGDFWEHSAVVKELSENMLHPGNPIINSDLPHPFFSPYSLLVSIFSRITNFNSVESLEIFAFLNLLFLLYTFYRFCKVLFKDNHVLISTLGLFFILFLWGSSPFGWSGFYHILVLNHVLPYPSTFAFSMSLLILSMIIDQPSGLSTRKLMLIIILCAVVFIVHPTTAIFLFVTIFTALFTFNKYSIKIALITSLIIIIPSILLCLIWPYFNFIELIAANNADFNRESMYLYDGLFEKNWPILLILPTVFLIKKDRIIAFLLLTIFVLSTLFTLGYYLQFYGVSRLSSNIMMMAQILIAYMAIISIKKYGKYGLIYMTFLVGSVLFSLYSNWQILSWKWQDITHTDKKDYTKFDFLRKTVLSDDLVLSDKASNWILTSYNGKVISSIHPMHWLDDIDKRRNDVDQFFSNTTLNSEREQILNTYQPDFILINHQNTDLDSVSCEWLRNTGEVIYAKDDLELIRLKPTSTR